MEGWWWLEGTGYGWINEWMTDFCLVTWIYYGCRREGASSSYLHWTLGPSVCCKANGSKIDSCHSASRRRTDNHWFESCTWRDWCVFSIGGVCPQTSVPASLWAARLGKHFSLFSCVFFTCHSACRWNCCQWIRHGCGCLWTRPSLLASGFPRARWSWLSSQCWQRSRKDATGNTVEQRDARKWGSLKSTHNHATCVLFPGLQNYSLRCAKCAFQLHHQQPDCSIRDNGKAPSAVYWPAGLVT